MIPKLSCAANGQNGPANIVGGTTVEQVVTANLSSDITLDINTFDSDTILFSTSSYGNGAKSVTFLPIPGNQITSVKDNSSTIWSEDDGSIMLAEYETAENHECVILTHVNSVMKIAVIYYKRSDDRWLPISRTNYFKRWSNYIANVVSIDISTEIPAVVVTRFKRNNHEAKKFYPMKGTFIESITEDGNAIWCNEGSICIGAETYQYCGRVYCAIFLQDSQGDCKEFISEKESGAWIRCIDKRNHTLKRAARYDIVSHNNPGIRLRQLLTLKHARVKKIETEPGCYLSQIRNGREVVWKLNKERDTACRNVNLFVNVKMKIFDFDVWHTDGSVTKMQIGNLNDAIGGWKQLDMAEGSEFKRITTETGFKWHEKFKHYFLR